MSWSPDRLVREICSEIDDRPLCEIAESICDVVFGSDLEWEMAPDGAELLRSIAEPIATDHLTLGESREASILASHIIDWANYGCAYGDYSGAPWEDSDDE